MFLYPFATNCHAAHQSNLQEVEEEEDGNPYDLYSDPDSNPSKRHEQDEPKEKQTVDSENTKLLEDALDDLSDEETPPHATETKLSSEEGEKTPVSATSVGSDKVSPKLMGKVWPPPAEDARDREPDSSPRVKPSQASVLKKWQPQEWKKESKQPPPTKIDIGGWLKNVTEKDKPGETEVAEQDPVSTKMSSSIPARDSLSHEKHEPAVFEDVPTKAFVSLKPVKKEQTSSSKSSSKENELAKIKLKSSGGKQVLNEGRSPEIPLDSELAIKKYTHDMQTHPPYIELSICVVVLIQQFAL